MSKARIIVTGWPPWCMLRLMQCHEHLLDHLPVRTAAFVLIVDLLEQVRFLTCSDVIRASAWNA